MRKDSYIFLAVVGQVHSPKEADLLNKSDLCVELILGTNECQKLESIQRSYPVKIMKPLPVLWLTSFLYEHDGFKCFVERLRLNKTTPTCCCCFQVCTKSSRWIWRPNFRRMRLDVHSEKVDPTTFWSEKYPCIIMFIAVDLSFSISENSLLGFLSAIRFKTVP